MYVCGYMNRGDLPKFAVYQRRLIVRQFIEFIAIS